jgi:hypothetical protein
VDRGTVQRTQPTDLNARRPAAAIASLVVAAYLVLGVGVVALEWSIHNGPDLSVLAPVGLSAYVLVGALIIIRRGTHPIGWILQAIGVTALITATSEDYAGYALVLHPGSLPFGQAMVVVDRAARRNRVGLPPLLRGDDTSLRAGCFEVLTDRNGRRLRGSHWCDLSGNSAPVACEIHHVVPAGGLPVPRGRGPQAAGSG